MGNKKYTCLISAKYNIKYKTLKNKYNIYKNVDVETKQTYDENRSKKSALILDEFGVHMDKDIIDEAIKMNILDVSINGAIKSIGKKIDK